MAFRSARTLVEVFVTTWTADVHASYPSNSIRTARDPTRWFFSTNGVVPARRPFSDTYAPDGWEETMSEPRNDVVPVDGDRGGAGDA